MEQATVDAQVLEAQPPPQSGLEPSSLPSFQPRYLVNFSCVGSACEDSCCSGWMVPISKADHRRLRVLIGAEELNRSTTPCASGECPQDEAAPGYAHFVQKENGSCYFLQQNGLCRTQAELGAEALTCVCRLYPRQLHQFDERFEQAATLACPEVARLCLLQEDAMDLVEFLPEPEKSLAEAATKVRGAANLYLSQFEPVREAIFEVVGERSLSLGDRLCLLLLMSETLGTSFTPGGKPNKTLLKGELQKLASPRFRRELSRSLVGVQATGPAVHILVAHVLMVYSNSAGGRMAAIRERVCERYQLENSTKNSLLAEDSYQEMMLRFEEGKAYSRRFARRVETYFTHYVKNYVLQSPYIQHSDLKKYVTDILLRVATLNFLFHSDPHVASALEEADDTSAQTALDRAAVVVFQAFAREVEHTPAISKKMHELLAQAQADSLGDWVCLSRLCS